MESADSDLSGLQQQYLDLQRAEKRYRNIEYGLSGILVLVILVFAVALYAKVRQNYTAEKLAPEMTKQVVALQPELDRVVRNVTTEVAPIYADLAQQKLAEVLPKVEESLGEEMAKLSEDIMMDLPKHLDTVLERSARRFEVRLQKEFPELATPEGAARLEAELDNFVQHDAAEFSERFVDRYAKDLNQVYGTLKRFRSGRFDQFDDQELATHYVHLWLTLLDQELVEAK